MRVDTKLVQKDLDNYLSVLLGCEKMRYNVPRERALELAYNLKQTILNLGINYMNGTQVCPWSRLGQKAGENGYALYDNLRMLEYNGWIIVFVVNEKEQTIRVTKLVHQGYNLGKRIPTKQGIRYSFENRRYRSPLAECKEWMIRLGCFN